MRGVTNETRRQGGIDWRLWLPGTLLLGCCLILSLLSWNETFEHGRFYEQRPLLLVVTVLADNLGVDEAKLDNNFVLVHET